MNKIRGRKKKHKNGTNRKETRGWGNAEEKSESVANIDGNFPVSPA